MSTRLLPRSARLLPRGDDGALLDLRSAAVHVAHFGAMPVVPRAQRGTPGALVDQIERAGLRGRGGGWFPTARKVRAVVDSAATHGRLSAGRHPVLVANAMEGEPAARKDATLLSRVPHLVLDGVAAAAATVGAKHAFIAVHRGSSLVRALDRALAERDDEVRVEVITPPARYVASEESALSHWAGDGIATPVFGARPFDAGVRGRPTLVLNAETLAHLALIARHGGDWFAQVGDPQAPGTTLVSVAGAVGRPGVIEVPTGTPTADIIELAGGLTGPVTGLLTGGYGGSWARAADLLATDWTPESVASAGGVIGAGVLVAVPDSTCALAEIARVTQWLAGESAGQCGPCRFGLPAISDDLAALAGVGASPADLDELTRRLPLVVGRGGCKHPDGAARFVATGLQVFADEVERHLAGQCSAASGPSILPVPVGRPTPVDRPGKELR